MGVRRRGGLDGAAYAWGDELTPGGQWMANTWQGEFPIQNTLDDGYEGTAPVGSFPANGYGLFDMIGNVWEWTTDGTPARPALAHLLHRGKPAWRTPGAEPDPALQDIRSHAR